MDKGTVYLIIGLLIIGVFAVKGPLFSTYSSLKPDVVFSHFAYEEDKGLIYTSNTFDFGDEKISTTRASIDGCAELTYKNGTKKLCENQDFFYNDYVRIKFSPIYRTATGGYAGG